MVPSASSVCQLCTSVTSSEPGVYHRECGIVVAADHELRPEEPSDIGGHIFVCGQLDDDYLRVVHLVVFYAVKPSVRGSCIDYDGRPRCD